MPLAPLGGRPAAVGWVRGAARTCIQVRANGGCLRDPSQPSTSPCSSQRAGACEDPRSSCTCRTAAAHATAEQLLQSVWLHPPARAHPAHLEMTWTSAGGTCRAVAAACLCRLSRHARSPTRSTHPPSRKGLRRPKPVGRGGGAVLCMQAHACARVVYVCLYCVCVCVCIYVRVRVRAFMRARVR